MTGARRMPFVIALAASAALHFAVLLSPGWALPLDDEHEPATIDAMLTPPPKPESKPAPAKPAPPPVKRPRPKPTPSATPDAPVAKVPGTEPATAPETQAAQATEEIATGTEPAHEPVPSAAPPAPSFTGRWPPAGRIVYQVTRGEGFIVGRSEHRWQHDGARYVLHAETETTGLAALFRPAKVIQESRGGFDATGLRPQAFDVVREGRDKESIRFDADRQLIVFGKGQSAPYVPAQDMLSLFHQLGIMPLPDKAQFTVSVATGRKLAEYRIDIGALEELETPLGQRRVRPLRISGSAREETTEIWLDAESGLPLKIRHRDRKGEVFDQIVTAMEVDKTE